MKIKANFKILIISITTLLSSCNYINNYVSKCTVVFEENQNITISKYIYEVDYNSDLSVSISVPANLAIFNINYDNYSLSLTSSNSTTNFYYLTLYSIIYPTLITFDIDEASTITYIDDLTQKSITQTVTKNHLATNTLACENQFTREGYVSLGWNTLPNNQGTHIGFGSRIFHEKDLILYPEFIKTTDENDFYWTKENNTAVITDYVGNGDLIIPSTLGGLPVAKINSGAFNNIKTNNVFFPNTLKTIEKGAFNHLECENLYIFDNIQEIKDDSFTSYSIKKLHINAAVKPVYSKNYFATFADKVDYLKSIQNEKKIIIFCGSSARFGYDSTLIINEFKDYNVANMGVYAYSNMRIQGEIISNYINNEDIILNAPELDAIDTQFCSQTYFDNDVFCLMEANYDLLCDIDISNYTKVFDSFFIYNQIRKNMKPSSYLESPSSYDEAGNETTTPTYNKYGDYILYRENNYDNKVLSPMKKAYFNPDYIDQEDYEGLNYIYSLFNKKGAKVFFSYSVRSVLGLSEDTTNESKIALDEEIRANLNATIINRPNDVIMPALYFFDTDNHLSSEGAIIHTKNIISNLKKIMEEEK